MRLRYIILLLAITFLLAILSLKIFDKFSENSYPRDIDKGISVAFFRRIEDSDMKQVEKTLDHLKDIGVTHISVVLFIYQNNKSSVQIYEDPDQTLPRNQLIDYIRAAKKRGFFIQLLPFLGIAEWDSDSVGRWSISPSSVDKWFVSYEKRILKYAELAEAEKVAVFGIGSEMSSLSGEADHWRKLIKKVRDVYRGKVLYAANWDDFTEGYFAEELGWLGEVDIIGVDAYFPLKTKENPSVGELQIAWEKWEKIFERLKRVDKKIIVSEIGITSTTEHFNEPWRFDMEDEEVDLLAQEKYYEASFKFFQNRVDGIYWWVIDDGLPPKNPNKDKGFSPLGKLAEGVLRKWYKADYN